MANAYGFDFLRTEHKDVSLVHDDDVDGDDDGSEVTDVVSHPTRKYVDVKNKPDLEKQYDILAFLQAHPGSGCLAPAIIYKATGIDLDVEVKVSEMLQRNPKVRVERVPDPENPSLTVATYAYQAKYSSVRDRTTLLAQINRMSSGVPMRDLLDSYPGVEEDLRSLITAGDIIAVYNSEDKDKILFPRGEVFLVELDGLVTLPRIVTAAQEENELLQRKFEETQKKRKQEELEMAATGPLVQEEEEGPVAKTSSATLMPPPPKRVYVPDCYVLETDVDPRKQIRRGEAICVGGQWFRTSSAVKAGVPLHEQPARAQAPPSVVLLQDLSKRNELDGYIRPLSETQIPLDGALSETALANLTAARVARESLAKMLHGTRSGSSAAGLSGGGSMTTAHLTGSYAHSSNPVTLAKSFAASTINNLQLRKRPNATTSNTSGIGGSKSGGIGTTNDVDTVLTKEKLEMAASDINLALYSHARRHGCTKDVREMYLQTRSLVPEADNELQKLLVEHKLLEPNEQIRRPRLSKQGSNVDNDGKPKKRRYYERKNQRMTNKHLEGTEIGAILARAAEKQKQGKSVGDGGM